MLPLEANRSLKTATTLTFAVAMLADNPHVLRRLREEVLSVLGPKQTPTFEHVREMKYLRAVINGEVPRLFYVDRRVTEVHNLQKPCDYIPLCKTACFELL